MRSRSKRNTLQTKTRQKNTQQWEVFCHHDNRVMRLMILTNRLLCFKALSFVCIKQVERRILGFAFLPLCSLPRALWHCAVRSLSMVSPETGGDKDREGERWDDDRQTPKKKNIKRISPNFWESGIKIARMNRKAIRTTYGNIELEFTRKEHYTVAPLWKMIQLERNVT